jgi:NAD(P)-dependent dehydrogenase (short-subunit alcohol dehydrogenase family)
MACRFGLKNKLVIVVGGSGLIGRKIVESLHEERAYVLNCDMIGGDVFFDMTQPDTIYNALDFFGAPDGFVNAGYPKNWLDHASGFVRTSEKVAEYMEKNGRCGSIVHFSSIYGVSAPDFSLYGAGYPQEPPVEYAFAKAGIAQMTRWMAKKYGRFGVRVNAVSPGGVLDGQEEQFVARYERRTPLGRMANQGDIVPVVLFLLSEASQYITGQNIVVDGGWTL